MILSLVIRYPTFICLSAYIRVEFLLKIYYLYSIFFVGTRESAYVLAVTSAGVSHAVTKACSSGLHDNCGCDRTIYDHPREPNFEWSGCSDNIYFGAEFSRQFLDVRERNRLKRNPKLGLTNLHNNYVGRHVSLYL
ncbi:unnamed protein product [Schistosoma mattheei]|uniref:Protein Wnt n=1 Tax=Schistosoma mattheei TaxID=31246 RepID=A0A183NRV2_9TREM|nr:unnamed protein product [Schistosoma mattheei]